MLVAVLLGVSAEGTETTIVRNSQFSNHLGNETLEFSSARQFQGKEVKQG